MLYDYLYNKVVKWLLNENRPKVYPPCDFDRICYEIRPCDVLLIEGHNRISSIIQRVTQSPWSHAALYLGHIYDIRDLALRKHVLDFYDGKEDDQLIIESLLGHGTVVSSITRYKDDHIRICRPSGLSGTDAQKVIGYALGRLGMDYDVRQILDLLRFFLPWSIIPKRFGSSLFKYRPDTSTRQICSTLIVESFINVKFPVLPLLKHTKVEVCEQVGPEKRVECHELVETELIPRNPRLYTPRDFDYSPFFEIIKYPIYELVAPNYHNLPWGAAGIYGNDDGELFNTKEELPKKSAHNKPNNEQTGS